jgi:hypothetical protein
MLLPCAAEVTGATDAANTPILGVAGYFKAGVYGQASGAAAATFYALNILHPRSTRYRCQSSCRRIQQR